MEFRNRDIILAILGIVSFLIILGIVNIINGIFVGVGLFIVYVLLKVSINFYLEKKLTKSKIEEVDTMDGRKFEKFLRHLFKKKGYKVELTRAFNDFGADLILTESNGKKIVVQAKRHKENIGIFAVQQVRASMFYYNADESWVVTNSFYTNPAMQLAKPNEVSLYNRNDLIKWIKAEENNVNKQN